MSDPEVLLREEERMVGCACRLLGHTALETPGGLLETVVYECGPRPSSKWAHHVQVRWAVFVNGKGASSSIISTRSA